MKQLILPALLLACPLLAACEPETPRTVTVTAEGWASADPSQARIEMRISAEGETQLEATQQLQSLYEALGSQLGRLEGTEAFEMESVSLDLERVCPRDPDMPYRRYNSTANCENGYYTASHALSVRMSPPDLAGNLSSFAYEIGATNIRVSGFSAEDDDELSRLAMSRAVQSARDNAQLIAEASGLELGPLLTLSPSNLNAREPVTLYRRAFNNDEVLEELEVGQPLDIAPDQVRRSVQIDVVFELVDPAPASND